MYLLVVEGLVLAGIVPIAVKAPNHLLPVRSSGDLVYLPRARLLFADDVLVVLEQLRGLLLVGRVTVRLLLLLLGLAIVASALGPLRHLLRALRQGNHVAIVKLL